MALLEVFGLLLIAGKLMGSIEWSWMIVLAPFAVVIAIYIVIEFLFIRAPGATRR
jgi:hypothetical protein